MSKFKKKKITQFNVTVERIETHHIKEHETQQPKTSYSLS